MASMNGDVGSQGQNQQYNAPAPAETSAPAHSPKDIAWYFCEQYYKTFSSNADKLHLFYNKNSQYVHGSESEKLAAAVGRNDIQARIKEVRDSDEWKTRISNVDALQAGDNIVIQVIGETADQTNVPKDFVQTFILAQQPSGYYVLNSILRYLKEDEEEEVLMAEGDAPAQDATDSSHTLQADPVTNDDEVAVEAAADVPEQKEDAPTPAPAEEPLAVAQVDEKLEQAIESVQQPATEEKPATNGVSANEEEAKDSEPVEVPIQAEEAPSTKKETKEVEPEAEATKAEVPQDPVPTPTETKTTPAKTPAPAAKAPTQAAPAKMSWASLASRAAATAPKPAVPQIKPVVPSSQPRAASAAKAPAAAPAPASPAAQKTAPAQAAPVAPATENKENDEPKGEGWQSVGENTKKQNRAPQAAAAPVQEKEGCLGYLRNVIESVGADDLKAAMSKHGKVTYLDINRAKNCGFIEFEDSTGYQAAFKANPIKVGDIDVWIESRRPKQAGFNNGPQQFNRGGMNQRGRGNFQQGGQRGRGEFNNNANRGRGGARGGRGGAGQAVASS